MSSKILHTAILQSATIAQRGALLQQISYQARNENQIS